MPKHRKRRFIDPKKSVTFEVVPRNQVDPLVADESAPQNVLVEKKTKRIIEIDSHEPKRLAKKERLEEQEKYGIYFDDDYNYLQHLRDVRVVGELEKIVRVDKSGAQIRIKEADDDDVEQDEDEVEIPAKVPGKSQILLPSSVFASHVEERVGHLHKGLTHVGPQPDWDPDVMAALDDDTIDVTSGDELEDDFVALASGGADAIEDLGAGDTELTARRFYFREGKGESHTINEEDEEFSMDSDGDGDYDVGSDFSGDDEDEDDDNVEERGLDRIKAMIQAKNSRFAQEETRSRFTNYSLSSSVMTRTGGLKSLDEQFEEMFDKEYDDCDIGALDGEGIEGRIPVESNIVTKLADLYEKEVRLQKGNVDESLGALETEVKSRVLSSLDRKETTEELKLVDNDPDKAEQDWDCESILSTYSNTHNRPAVIDYAKKKSAVQLSSRGMPMENSGLSKKNLKQLDDGFAKSDDYAKSVCSRASLVSAVRPKHESTEDKKTRKTQVKEFRRERRIEKKQSKEAFRAEEGRQKVQEMNVRNNLQGLKLY